MSRNLLRCTGRRVGDDGNVGSEGEYRMVE